MHILIIGGTRNLGHLLTQALLADHHTVTLLNRGLTPDELPADLERLRADRTAPEALERALRGRRFDAVIDTALYKGPEAQTIISLLGGSTDHYIFISTGQVYLVREGIPRPFREEDYAGRVMPRPKPLSVAEPEWLYGVEKRAAEDALSAAWADYRFPFTSLRLPMVNGERDHFHRLYNYVLRLKDGGPILTSEASGHALRHVYSGDVVQAVQRCLTKGAYGRAYNISQDETVSLEDFLGIVADLLGRELHLCRLPTAALEANGFLPDCSPFSERWMSELANERSKQDLGMRYTPLREYLARIIDAYEASPPQEPKSYERRPTEIRYARERC